MTLDRRLHAYRPDLASARLAGRVEAGRFVAGKPARLAVPVADLRPRPEETAGIDTQILFGETLTVLDRQDGWAWVQCDLDDYVGYLREDELSPVGGAATHRVAVPRTFAYSAPDMKWPVVRPLSMGSRLTATGTAETRGLAYLTLDDGSAVVADHCIGIPDRLPDPVAVAERFLETPYLWGGRSGFGLDCSGLVQLSLQMAGQSPPRDSDMQAGGLGTVIDADDRKRGDLVFWRGHAAIMADRNTMIHASGKAMLVCREDLDAAIARIRPLYGEPTVWRRPQSQ